MVLLAQYSSVNETKSFDRKTSQGITSQHCFRGNAVMAKSTFLVYLLAEGLNEQLQIFWYIFSPFSD